MQISVGVTSSSLCTNSDKFKPSPKTSELCSTSVDKVCRSVSSVADNGTVGTVSTSDVSVLSSGSAISNGSSVTKSSGSGEVVCCRSAVCHVSQTESHYSTSSSPSLSSPLTTCSTGVISSPSTALNPPTRSPTASVQPVAMNWDVRMSPVSALHTSPHTAVPGRNASVLSSPSENNRHRSVKAGSTWYPTELQTSVDCGSVRKRNGERSTSAHASVVCAGGGGSTLSSPLKKFVDRHLTRNAAVGPNVSHSSSSEGAGFSRSGIAGPELTSDQPMDLSTPRRRSAHRPEQPNRTHFDTTTSCDEPLDLSRSSQTVRADSRTTRHHHPVSQSSRSSSESVSKLALPVGQSSRSSSEKKLALPSGMIDLQNYCSRLLSGGYSLDSPLLSTITSSSSAAAATSFSSLVSIKVCFYISCE